MRMTTHILLVIFTLMGTLPSGAFARAPQLDCVICGHVCCCPEICAPKLRSLREMKNGCNQAGALCKAPPSMPMELINLLESSVWSDPHPRLVERLGHQPKILFRRLVDDAIPLFSQSTTDIQTPPPRTFS